LAPDDWGVPALRHGPAAAERAAQDGEADPGILDAVRYHSVGYLSWDSVGRILYLADYLEPGRSFHQSEHELLLQRVPHDLENVLREVASQRIADAVISGARLLAETTAFWNDLVCRS
jgi:HD superfamily phosphohydrolase YqeK